MGRGTLTPQEEELKKVISNNIRTKIKEEGISQAEFARRAGIPPTTLSGYIKGVTRPNAGNLQKISDTLGLLKSDIDPSYKQGCSLEDWNNNKKQSHLVKKITEISSQLEEPRQKIVLETATNQLDEQIKKKRLSFFSNKVDFDKISNIVPYDPNKEGYAPVIGEIAAGTPILSEQNFEGMRPVYGKYAGRDDIFWLRVKGESMETEIHDGSFALILQDPDLSEGSIGAVRFIDDNEATLKCVFYEYDENGYPLCLRLEPLNPDYPIQYADEYNPAVIEGRLVKVEQDY